MLKRDSIKKRFPILAQSYRWIKRRQIELSALPHHIKRKLSRRKNPHNRKIRIVFICQYIPAWSKNKQLYENAAADDRFQVLLLCIPNRISANKLIDVNDLSNDAYDYFSAHGYKEAVNALIGRDTWFDLKAFQPDYVIYNRFDRPMPIPYTSSVVSTYSKICFIEYGTPLIRFEEGMVDKKFVANTFCYFAESQSIKSIIDSWNSLKNLLGLSISVCCGIPAVENAYNAREDCSPSWDFSGNAFRIIYTPRWTMDPAWGGSSFLKYKKQFLDLADQYDDIDILIRPHPLMFDHFVDTGLLTLDDVSAYQKECEKRNNTSLDTEKEYLATFWNSSVLICDYSSIIIEYFVTGKPIIFLAYRDNIEYTQQMNTLLQGCYLANNEQELVKTILQLKNGDDPLFEIRKKICEEELLIHGNTSVSNNMKSVLLANYNK